MEHIGFTSKIRAAGAKALAACYLESEKNMPTMKEVLVGELNNRLEKTTLSDLQSVAGTAKLISDIAYDICADVMENYCICAEQNTKGA